MKYNEKSCLRAKFTSLKWDEIEEVGRKYEFKINNYLATLVSEFDGPLGKQFIPSFEELESSGYSDPLAEEINSPVTGLVHRYPNRVLLLLTDECFARCRFCTRKRIFKEGYKSSNKDFDRAAREKLVLASLEYIKKHPEINDILISGGDPFTLSDEELATYLDKFEKLDQLDLIRIGTRALSVFPERITAGLIKVLHDRSRLFINVHFNHLKEITDEVKNATAKLIAAGIPLGCQTVLLKGVNDDPYVLQELFYGLLRLKIKPYYLHMMDLTEGTAHFRVSVTRAKEIYFRLSGRISGMALPKMVIDLPGGGGKIPVVPDYLVKENESELVYRNFTGKLFSYKKVQAEK